MVINKVVDRQSSSMSKKYIYIYILMGLKKDNYIIKSAGALFQLDFFFSNSKLDMMTHLYRIVAGFIITAGTI